MEEEDEISQLHAKLSNLVNSMKSLWEEISETKVVRKVLKSLPKRFRPKVTAIEERKNI